MANLFWFIVLIGILIFAHESGHFLFAKLFRVKVLTFSLGFGTPIRLGRFKLSFRRGETEYRLAWFPMGGFVRMLGEDPTEEIAAEEQARSFPYQKPWKRFLIIFAGPMFSILLAVPIFFIYHVLQDKAPASVIGRVVPGSPAAVAGLHPEDRVLAIDGRSIRTWEEIDTGIQDAEGESIELAVDRNGQGLNFTVSSEPEFDDTGLELEGKRWDIGLRFRRQGKLVGVVSPDSPAHRAGLRSWDGVLTLAGIPVRGWRDIRHILENNGGHLLPVSALRLTTAKAGAVTLEVPRIVDTLLVPAAQEKRPEGVMAFGDGYFGLEPIDLYINTVEEEKPADKIGIEPGDKIVAMAGETIFSWDQFTSSLISNQDQPIELKVRRGSKLMRFVFEPEMLTQTTEFKQKIRKLGLGVGYVNNIANGEFIDRPQRFRHAVKMAFVDTGGAMAKNVMGFVRIFEGRVKATEAIGGPGMIAAIAGKSAKMGWQYFVQMMAVLSTLLGILNLLPIPILDGGHILFILLEAVMRRPVPMKVRIFASYIGLFLLMSLMLFAIGNDIRRYWEEITSVFG